MATAPQTPAARPGPTAHDPWQQLGGYAAQTFGNVWRFFSTYPPLAQGLYYVLLGLWPLVDIGGYREATGEQHAPWMAQTVGVLLLVVGGTLCLAAYRRQSSPEVLLLAFGSALGLVAVNVH